MLLEYRRPKGVARLRKAPPFVVLLALIALGLMFLVAALAPALAPYDIRSQQLLLRLQPPSILDGRSGFFLGTDQLGRDVLSRLLFALRTTLLISSIGTAVGLIVGVTAGLTAGMFGGWLDRLVVFLIDVQLSIPSTLLALTAVVLFGTDLVVLILIVGLSGWEVYARVVRGQVLTLRQRPFVEAAAALGVAPYAIAFRHVLPHLASTILVLLTVNFNYIIMLESALSFLGLGVQPPDTSLGAMVGAARNYLVSNWTLAALPSILIVAVTLATALVGDWLRDVLDPKFDD